MKSVRFQQNHGSLSRFGKVVSVAAVLLIAFISYLAVNPRAHEFFHHDADHPDHECVVTAFAAGEGLYLAPAIELWPTAVVVQRVHFGAGEVLRDAFARLLPPACGPPVRSLIA
ncbi:MAG TPA: hypothetical protein VMC06_03735 [Opitutaceae bacterium]|nr:hypothetical protein [Opitutaceae bacterium]